jgi:hypothetical protein
MVLGGWEGHCRRTLHVTAVTVGTIETHALGFVPGFWLELLLHCNLLGKEVPDMPFVPIFGGS